MYVRTYVCVLYIYIYKSDRMVGSGESGRTVYYVFLGLNFIYIDNVSFIMAYLMYISRFGNYVID